MAKQSSMIALGTKAPAFDLIDTISNRNVNLSNLSIENGLVVMFICNHCPYVKLILPQLITLVREYQQKGITFVAINSNDIITYPEDAPLPMSQLATELEFSFPYLFDETQKVAKAYQAECTPDFFIFDENLQCVYRGRFDDANPGNHKTVTGSDLKLALETLLAHKPPLTHQYPSIGCGIKWKEPIHDAKI